MVNDYTAAAGDHKLPPLKIAPTSNIFITSDEYQSTNATTKQRIKPLSVSRVQNINSSNSDLSSFNNNNNNNNNR
jgi:hypothetical protein